jgi:hypothetical protein
MKTQTIPADQWSEFAARFSREHAEWPTTIKVLDREAGPLNVATDVPLQGISFDTKGTRASALQVSVGDADGEYIRHVIDLPLRISQAEEGDGAIDLEVESARGPLTLIRVHEPAS